jgi:hypothetical protein
MVPVPAALVGVRRYVPRGQLQPLVAPQPSQT